MKKKRKVKKRTPVAPPKIVRRQKALEAATKARKRGERIDFTTMRSGAKTQFGKKIALCPECGQKGQLSDGQVWGNSVLFTHRGLLKEEVFKSTEICVATRRDVR